MNSMHNQKLEFLHFSFFLFFAKLLHNFFANFAQCLTYFSTVLWFDLFEVLISISLSNPWKNNKSFFIFHFVKYFLMQVMQFYTLFRYFSKILLILQLISYCKNTMLFKCLLLKVYQFNLNSTKLNALVCIFLFHEVKTVLSNVISCLV